MSFHNDSAADSFDIDHGITEDDYVGSRLTQIGDDELADPDGAAERASVKKSEKGAAPPYVMQDFDWRSTVDLATGENRWYMSPRREAVERTAASAPERVLNARMKLDKEDRALVKVLVADIESLVQTLHGVDTWVIDAPIRMVADQITRAAVQVARWKEQLNGARQYRKPGEPRKDWEVQVHQMAVETGRRAGIFAEALQELKPDFELNYSAAAWSAMRYAATKNQERFLNPDQIRAKTENEQNATDALVDDL